jgi:UDP-N-acetylmuramoyl-tripeptide--D-alanyl-D-alanine ligase
VTAHSVLTGLAILASIVWLLPLVLLARRYLHILQLEEYDNKRFFRWTLSPNADQARVWRWRAAALAMLIGLAVLLRILPLLAILLIVWLLPAIIMTLAFWPAKAKKPLNYTARIKRLVAATALVALAVAGVVSAITHYALATRDPFADSVITPVGIIFALLVLDAGVVVAGNWIARPVEAALRQRYINDAKRRVRRLNPRIIGITGSYGKTTTKELLGTILSSRFPTFRTPESWNTLMGVTRAIRERLTAQHEIFVVEMGAYKRGEIRALCELTGPLSIGILTGINEQHLERFGGIENTIKAKYELIQAVQPGGLAVFNVDNPYCRALADQTSHARVARVGISSDSDHLDYTARNVAVSTEGTRFTVVAGDQEVSFRTALLGEHFILNVLAATAAAVECGMTLQQIAAAVAAMPPVPHRLQLLPAASGITTIDDAYSANPDGARAALRVLSQMNGGRRILVTPGFIELGNREREFNRELGTLASGSCDLLVLVGARHTEPIRDGAVDAGMSPDSIKVVESVSAARGFLSQVSKPGDTILFENDLPDNYDE